MPEDDTGDDLCMPRRPHVVIVLSGPRGPDGRRETNANYERLRTGLRVAALNNANLIISGHPAELGLLKHEALIMAADENIAADMHVDPWAPHTVGNAQYALAKVRYMWRNWKGRGGVIHVVSSTWHMDRVDPAFRVFHSMFGRYDPSWRDFRCRLAFHSAQPETDPDITAHWSALEASKRVETGRFLKEWQASPERFMNQIQVIKDQILAEAAAPQRSLITSLANVEMAQIMQARSELVPT